MHDEVRRLVAADAEENGGKSSLFTLDGCVWRGVLTPAIATNRRRNCAASCLMDASSAPRSRYRVRCRHG